MAKKIGMITFYRDNYGAFLQAYALQQILLKLGYSPELIRYDFLKDRSILGVPLAHIKQPKKFIIRLAAEVVRYKEHRIRSEVFAESIAKYLKESDNYYRTYNDLKRTPPEYDIYLTGSDQVFNPELSPQAFEARLLGFVKNGRRASYAASAGDGRIKKSAEPICVSQLKMFDSISVREAALKEYLQKEHGIPSQQHIDPTFLLRKEDWADFGKTVLPKQEKYIFYYRVQPQPELWERANQVSRELGLPIFVADRNDRFANQVPRAGYLSPEQWVGMLQNAEYVVTNSFHGSAFAINLGKKVSVMVPNHGGERLLSLLEKCNLLELPNQKIMREDPAQVYADAAAYFEKERVRAEQYLRSL